MYIIKKDWRDIKPPPGSQLDFTHPLAQGMVGCWLMNEGGGTSINNLVNNKKGSISGIIWYKKNKGIGLKCNNTGDLINTNFTSAMLKSPNVFSFRILYFSISAGIGNVLGRLINFTTSGYWYNDSAVNVQAFTNSKGTVFTGVNLGVTANSYNDLIMTNDGVTNKVYNNNVLKNSTTTNTSGNLSGTLYFGTNGLNRANDAVFFLFQIYSRVLSPTEISSLYKAPYQIIKPRISRFISIGAGVTPPPTGVARWRSSFTTMGVG